MLRRVPRTVEEPVRIGPFDATDWLIILLALLLPRLFYRWTYNVYLLGMSLQSLLFWIFLATGYVILQFFKWGKPRGYLWASVLYAFRPNRYK
ncbi:hypothetical protein [Gloeobacter kilaueensis]|uniref:Uncharacterized protein n=1 Tax=Gloeobacter kilaueensis (strain ATCC BAA-2537 / CCAP 1431/1 / ULC 316 / JS1) TaxID=1183438 RepID=U5QK11_GLOK1|nr:hypothetical protein [Gloeobacter kilaueensis]AGY58005.1 hypothetical protein GKIL_1759 [Gloeobacter kilaueensis JS1]